MKLQSFIQLAAVLPIVGLVIHVLCRKRFVVHNGGIVLVTGASTGIGRHAVEHLALKHDFLILAGVRKEKDAESIRNLKIKNLQPIFIDVSSHESCVNAVKEIESISSNLKLPFVGLVNNAGISRSIPLEFHDLNDARSIFDTNFFGMADITQLLLPQLRNGHGRVVMISSVAGLVSAPRHAIYSASKFAMEAFSDALRREVDHFGISVSVVQPAFVASNIHDKVMVAVDQVEDQSAMKELYPALFSEKKMKSIEAEVASASSPTVTSEAIEHALTSEFPQTRYPVASAAGFPAILISWMNWLFSDRIDDFILAASY